MRWTVTLNEQGKTLLSFLKEKHGEGLSSNKIKKAIESKSCRINQRIECFSSFLLREGDIVEFYIEEVAIQKIQVIFEDPFFVVIDKPAGLVSENAAVFQKMGLLTQNWRLVHRLDKDTSGLLLIAKTDEAEKAAKKLFSTREIQKIYLAIVDGKVKEKEGIIDTFLGEKGRYQGQTLYGEVKENGLRSITHFTTLASEKTASLVLCDLKTGRTHQIRVHLSEKGHPLLGDFQYGSKGFDCSYKASRHFLHAWKLVFIHPFTGKKISLRAPFPSDFQKALKELFPEVTL